jgi:hypothetical protein
MAKLWQISVLTPSINQGWIYVKVRIDSRIYEERSIIFSIKQRGGTYTD